MSQARYLKIILVHNFAILVHIFLMWGLCLSMRNRPGGMLHKVSIITGNSTPPLPPTPPFITDFCRDRFVHRDRYLQQHKTEKIET
jgi:hypothetical protein